MSFGQVWRTSEAKFWDEMWAKHKDSPMTKRLLALVAEHDSVCEVGCGHGHFVQALIDSGWRGRFCGYEMSSDGTRRTVRRCRRAGIDADLWDGDFLKKVGASKLPDCEAAVCRGVVQHQAHWMPMVMAMLRIAPIAYVGIGYVSPTEFHAGPLRSKGHYDVQISPKMLVQEARAAGLKVWTHRYENAVRGCDELLAVFNHG